MDLPSGLLVFFVAIFFGEIPIHYSGGSMVISGTKKLGVL
jgi:hypothetical protein